jgi:hypothetical protein
MPVSEEVFKFKGVWNSLFGLLVRRSIRKAHRRHIEALKRSQSANKGALNETSRLSDSIVLMVVHAKGFDGARR